jgi:hypothetical protein
MDIISKSPIQKKGKVFAVVNPNGPVVSEDVPSRVTALYEASNGFVYARFPNANTFPVRSRVENLSKLPGYMPLDEFKEIAEGQYAVMNTDGKVDIVQSRQLEKELSGN